MRKKTQKILSLILAFVMVLAILPAGLTVSAAGTPGTVTNVVTKFSATTPTVALETAVSNPSLLPVTGSTSVSFVNYTTQSTTAAKISSTLASTKYWTSTQTAWLFGDCNPKPANENTGNASDTAIRAATEFVQVTTGTSATLLGTQVTKVLTLNAEKAFTPAIPDVYSFTIDKPATIYVATPFTSTGANFDANFVTANGWTRQTSMNSNRSQTTIIQDTGTGSNNTGLYYAIPNGNANSLAGVYSKHFASGTVNIPSRGAAVTTSGMAIYVVWDECNADTTLSSLNYSYTGEANTFGSVGPWNIGDASGTYTVNVGPSVTSVTLSATSATGGTIAYGGGTNTVSVPGSKVITVTAANGTTMGTYTVNFANASAVSNTVVNYAKRTAWATGAAYDATSPTYVGYGLTLNGTDVVNTTYFDKYASPTGYMLVNTTSPIFMGGTIVRDSKYDGQNGGVQEQFWGPSNIDWASFQVQNDCTVYYAPTLSTSNPWRNGLDRGWTKDLTGLKINDSMVRSVVYYKAFHAGESVIIPNMGGNLSVMPGTGPAIVIVWAKDKITSITLNTPENLNQDTASMAPVSFTATPTPLANCDTSTIQWWVNGEKQATTGTTFSYTPTAAGDYVVTNKVSDNATATVETRTIHVEPVKNNNTAISSLSYTHPELGTQVVTVVPGTTTYNIELPYGISSANAMVTPVVADPGATILSNTPATTIPGSATFVVKASDGTTTATYNINFTLSTTQPASGVGTVTNIIWRGKTSAESGVVAVNGLQASSPVIISSDNITYPTLASKVAAATGEDNLYRNDTFRVYSDRQPSVSTNNGLTSNYPINSSAEFVYVVSGNAATSPEFVSPNVTRILTRNDEKNNTDSIPNAYSFTIDKPATVNILIYNSLSSNITSNGWTLDNTGLQINRASMSNTQFTTALGGDNKYYSIPNGYGNAFNCYTKHYVAGANVLIPSTGASSSSGLVVLIKWDTVQPQQISALSLNTPTNLNQTYGSTTAVSFDASTTPAVDIDRSKIEYYINGVKQTTAVRSKFSYTPTNAGTYVITTSVSDNPGATVDSKTIIVAKKDPTGVTWPTPDAVDYISGLTLASITLPTGFAWVEPTTPLSVSGGSYPVIYTPDDEINYNTLTQEVAVVVNPLKFGDVSGDGTIDISDVIMAAEIAVGYPGYTPEQIIRANVSDKTDMTVDISDVVMIAERAVGSTTTFPVDEQ